MTNKPKSQGTAEETRHKRAAEAAGLAARRWENGAPGRDVDVDADRLRIHEVKHRANLNIHKTLANTMKLWPSHPAAVIWKRSSRKGDNTRRTADGPTIAALPESDYLDLLVVARAARVLREATQGRDIHSVERARDLLFVALRRIDAVYPTLEEDA